jgi:uncharacterized protein YhfF
MAAQGEPWSEAGHLMLVLDGCDRQLCIIETLEVTIKPYNEVAHF